MKKILLVFEGTTFSEGAFEFARRLNETERILLGGIFAPEVSYASLWGYAGTAGGTLVAPLPHTEDEEIIRENINRFKRLCVHNNIEYRVHDNPEDFVMPELKKESRFADLIIMGSEDFYAHTGPGDPNDYIKMALHNAECPILIVPEKFDYPENNVLSYDGSESSVFAIKQFAYLFPGFAKNPTLLVYSKDELKDDIPDIGYIEELAARHFPDLSIMKLHLDPKDFFATWIREKENAVLVSGSFGRSSLSRVFKKSFIKDVIEDHKLPIFITHR